MAEPHAGCRIEILPPAQFELEQIVQLHLSLSGAKYARELSEELLKALERLADFPLSGSPLRDGELRALGYRFLLVRSYLLIYRLIGDTVYVYHAVHGKTNYPTLFRSGDFS